MDLAFQGNHAQLMKNMLDRLLIELHKAENEALSFASNLQNAQKALVSIAVHVRIW